MTPLTMAVYSPWGKSVKMADSLSLVGSSPVAWMASFLGSFARAPRENRRGTGQRQNRAVRMALCKILQHISRKYHGD